MVGGEEGGSSAGFGVGGCNWLGRRVWAHWSCWPRPLGQRVILYGWDKSGLWVAHALPLSVMTEGMHGIVWVAHAMLLSVVTEGLHGRVWVAQALPLSVVTEGMHGMGVVPVCLGAVW